MPAVTEPLLTHRLWSHLEAQGNQVAGEVPLENGRIDLVAKTPEGEFVGYEVKDQKAIDRANRTGPKPGAVRALLHQLYGYAESGFLDRLYYCSQEPESILDLVESNRTMIDVDAMNGSVAPIVSSPERVPVLPSPTELGVIRILSDPVWEVDILRKAGRLSRVNELTLPKDNEPEVLHRVWTNAGVLCTTDTYMEVPEGTIPNPDGSEASQIDLVVFDREVDPTRVLADPQAGAIGVEVKGKNIDSYNLEDIREQLRKYANSGALTQLYLAVPAIKRTTGLELIRPSKQATMDMFVRDIEPESDVLDAVGLVVVDGTGDIEVLAEAVPLEMRYDGIATSELGKKEAKAIGWGTFVHPRDRTEFKRVYHQVNPIVWKARAIDLQPDEWQTPLGRAVQRVQSGGKPTKDQQQHIERTYEQRCS